jgi:hypothetical protein
LNLYKCQHLAGCWWLTPVTLATQEAEVRKIEVWSQPGKIVYETPSQKKISQKKAGGAQGIGPHLKPQYCKTKNVCICLVSHWSLFEINNSNKINYQSFSNTSTIQIKYTSTYANYKYRISIIQGQTLYCHLDRLRERLGEIQHAFIIKTLKKLIIKGTNLNIIWAIYYKPIAQYRLATVNMEILETGTKEHAHYPCCFST